MKRILPIFLAAIFLAACSRKPLQVSIPDVPNAAVKVVRASYKADIWTPDSTAIAKVEHFTASERQFIVITFRGEVV